ncbi:MAG TPA: branched-chain amino acid ABC transporter permease [Streptosporangiaceae bacterium]|nr:branched-chain amino acid ABC transporter permease [Streptosporangiaceae bacterium]
MLEFVNLTLSGITGGMVFAAVALALVLIWRSTRIVNFAQGGMLMLTTFLAWTVVHDTGSYWLALITALGAGLLLGGLVERLLIRPVERRPPLNAVIVTLGLLVLLQAVAGMIWGGSPHSYPPAFSIQGFAIGGNRLLLSPADLFVIGAVALVMAVLVVLFRRTSLGLRMRATAYAPEVARLLGVRVGRMLTLGWAMAAVVGALAGVLIAPSVFVGPNQFDQVLVYGFTAAIIGGLESPVGAVVGGLALGCVLSYVSGYAGSDITTLGALGVLIAVLMIRPAGLFGSTLGRSV